jgi:hypothetical protein
MDKVTRMPERYDSDSESTSIKSDGKNNERAGITASTGRKWDSDRPEPIRDGLDGQSSVDKIRWMT